MGAVAIAPPPHPATRVARTGRLFEAGGDTLEDSILRAWDELVSAGRTRCPVCAGEMHAASGCEACGSELT